MSTTLRLGHRCHEKPVGHFLSLAIELDYPTIEELVNAGLAHYHASEYTRQLEQAGEITTTGWHPEARQAYRALLVEADDPSKTTHTKSRRLDLLPESERPREKALWRGIGALSDSELLAILLRTGGSEGVLEMADRLLTEHDGLLALADQNIDALMRQKGVGEAKATEISAAFELGRRLATARRRQRPCLKTPEAVVALLREDIVAHNEERFLCLPLDARCRLIREPILISKGDVDGTDAGPRLFFRNALQAHAVTAIAIHNHPTGEVEPSTSDINVTRRLVQAGRMVDVQLSDHLIIGDGGRYTSLRREQPHLWQG